MEGRKLSWKRAALAAGLGTVLLLQGCPKPDLAPLTPCVVSGFVRKVRITNIDAIDLLFVIDVSQSMIQEQEAIKSQISRLVSILASGDTNGDGNQDFPPPPMGIHFAVANTDLGSGRDSDTVFNCDRQGEDGNFITTSAPARGPITTAEGTIPADPNTECLDGYPPAERIQGGFVTYTPPANGGVDQVQINRIAKEIGCRAKVGVSGCGFEQQLEATLKALTPSSSALTFTNSGVVTKGVGDGPVNNGFLRQDSLLAIILVSDENDCSAADNRLFAPPGEGPYGTNQGNLRCWQFGREQLGNDSPLHPVERYVEGLLALRPDPDLVVFSAISGIDKGILLRTGQNFSQILADPSMQERPDPNVGTDVLNTQLLVPSCDVPGVGKAFPPTRMVQVAQGLADRDSNGIVQSICQSDYTEALNAVIDKIADVLRGACLSRELPVANDGRVACEVVETLPPASSGAQFTRCEDLAGAGREFVRKERDPKTGVEREVCRIRQIPLTRPDSGTPAIPNGEVGWYYDDFSQDVKNSCPPENQFRVSFTQSAEPRTGSNVRIECLLPVQDSGGNNTVGIGERCASTDFCAGSTVVPGMVCESESQTCQRPCGSDADCRELGGYVCDTNRNTPICVNPTCRSQ